MAAQPNMEIVKEAIEVGEKVVDNLADQKEMEVESFSKSASAIRDFVLANMEDVTSFIRQKYSKFSQLGSSRDKARNTKPISPQEALFQRYRETVC